MRSSPLDLTSNLGAVFGPLSDDQDLKVRELLRQGGSAFTDAISVFGGSASYGSTPSGLTRMSNGHESICGGLSMKGGDDLFVGFLAELSRPSRRWLVESEIYADCNHRVYHGNDHLVWSAEVEVDDPVEAALRFTEGIQQLLTLAADKQPQHWIDIAEDY